MSTCILCNNGTNKICTSCCGIFGNKLSLTLNEIKKITLHKHNNNIYIKNKAVCLLQYHNNPCWKLAEDFNLITLLCIFIISKNRLIPPIFPIVINKHNKEYFLHPILYYPIFDEATFDYWDYEIYSGRNNFYPSTNEIWDTKLILKISNRLRNYKYIAYDLFNNSIIGINNNKIVLFPIDQDINEILDNYDNYHFIVSNKLIPPKYYINHKNAKKFIKNNISEHREFEISIYFKRPRISIESWLLLNDEQKSKYICYVENLPKLCSYPLEDELIKYCPNIYALYAPNANELYNNNKISHFYLAQNPHFTLDIYNPKIILGRSLVNKIDHTIVNFYPLRVYINYIESCSSKVHIQINILCKIIPYKNLDKKDLNLLLPWLNNIKLFNIVKRNCYLHELIKITTKHLDPILLTYLNLPYNVLLNYAIILDNVGLWRYLKVNVNVSLTNLLIKYEAKKIIQSLN